MRLTVIGATGGIGKEVVRQALERGHEVTAAVRDPDGLPAGLRERAEVVRADVLDPDALAPLVKGRDAVISALGTRTRGPDTIQADGARSEVAAMTAAGVRRLLLVGAAGAVDDPADGPFTRYAVKPLLQRILRDNFLDLAEGEEIVRRSDLDWTIVRPPRLLDRPGKGAYRSAVGGLVRGGRSIARADVATALLDFVGNTGTHRKAVGIAD
ncbi:NAD(P)-dependent oxidoreductase [Actinomadura parmotrematis]|uniref:SDR family oxidoreductase n=1 Tax=Actinomadura parmotrematis TaxID=2864039 RepID=A0ABS7FKT4_9ACTN|nr:SDR family oxidoreductase [Actinomadura parmotrematis]MBW8480980.1 SDR family oxidoreductase [Actinomadura parmotrematis]